MSNTHSRISAATGFFILISTTLLFCSSLAFPETTQPSTAPRGQVPPSVMSMVQFSKAVFDATNNGDWEAAAKNLASLKSAYKTLHADVAKPNGEQKKR